MKKFILYNSGFHYLNQIWNVVIGVLLVPIYISNIGFEKYGIWLSFLALISIFFLFDPGFTFVLPPRLAQLNLQKNKFERNKFYTSSFLLNFILSILLIVLFLLGILICYKLDFHNKNLNFCYENKYLISIYIISQTYYSFVGFVSLGLEIKKASGIIQVFTNLVYITIVLILITRNFGIISFLIANVLRNISYFLIHFYYFHFRKNLNFTMSVDFIDYKSNIIPQNLSTIAVELPRSMPGIIIGSIAPSFLASIKLFQTIPELARGFIEKPFYFAISPLRNKLQYLMEDNFIINGVAKLLAIIFSISVLFFINFNEDILKLWLKHNFEIPKVFIIVITFFVFVGLISKILVYIMYSANEYKLINKRLIFIGIIYLMFSPILYFQKFAFLYYILMTLGDIHIIYFVINMLKNKYNINKFLLRIDFINKIIIPLLFLILIFYFFSIHLMLVKISILLIFSIWCIFINKKDLLQLFKLISGANGNSEFK